MVDDCTNAAQIANNLVAKTGVEKPLKVSEEIGAYNKTLYVNGGLRTRSYMLCFWK